MFKTFVGPVEDNSAVVWLRPETARASSSTSRSSSRSAAKIPFGIAQIGKAFRNEITPGNFIFRTREFEQMELEFFVEPGSDQEWHQRWIDLYQVPDRPAGGERAPARARLRGAGPLRQAAVDIEYKFPFGWSELEGIANRADFDLSQHQKFSGQDLSYHDQETDTRYIPYVVEPSAGADRSALAFLVDAYREEEARTGLGRDREADRPALRPPPGPDHIRRAASVRNEQLIPAGLASAAPCWSAG